jgi:hypothetical protein
MTDFSFIKDVHMRNTISNGYAAVTLLELWDWLKNYKPDDDLGFMFSGHPNIYKIADKMESLKNPPGHSGASFGVTMRHLEYIAKKGIETYKQQYPPGT